ncbi:MAG: MFS transporter [Elusimicrobiaceae bacterium]|nr:MFS transporter [Elusimicrobiaceae bacterium]
MNTRKLFTILFLLNLFNYIDRQVLFSVFPLIQNDLHISDFQLGALASVFMLVYMCYAPVVGFFADRHPRQYWIAASALLWSAATFFSGLAKNYASLFSARALVGVGEGGFTTIAQPFLAEQYPKDKRATILAYFGLAMPAGAALGYLFGGVIGANWGWRMAFFLVGIPGILLGLGALLFIKDREHRSLENRKKPSWKQYTALFQNEPFIFLCLAHAMQTFVLGGVSAWMPTYFNRFFDMDPAQAGLVFGAMVIVGGALGTFLGGKIADRLLKKTDYAYFVVIAACFILMIPFAAAAVLSHRLPFSLITFSISIVLIFAPLAPISASLVALSSRKIRSMAFAVNIFLIHALGDAISPAIIGRASDLFGLKMAFLCTLALLLPACLFLYSSVKTARAEGRLIRYYAQDMAE